ncbi:MULTISPECIES: HNH endonuclease [Dietzia]|nr:MULTISPECIES: HNH endonuclease signature motif containing protein [Dietzia]
MTRPPQPHPGGDHRADHRADRRADGGSVDCPAVAAAGAAAVQALYAENIAAAARLRACYHLYTVCEDEQERRDLAAGYDPELDLKPEHAVIDPFHIACAEIVAAYGVHNNRARTLLTRARTLITRFPTLVEAMETGRLDEDTADLLARHMRTVDSAHRRAVQQQIIDWLLAAIAAGTRPGREAILGTLDRIITDHDPAGVRARRAAATRERHIRLRRGTDGMADLIAHLTATEASTLYEVLHRAATEQATRDKTARLQAAHAGDHTLDAEYIRSIDELRADALVAAFLDPAGPDHEADPQHPARAGTRPLATQVRPTITVLAPLGPDGEPEVYLPRGGPATIEALIELLARSVGATITVPHTEPGTADAPDTARRYRISAELAHRIRLRDGTCRHPGCSVPAQDCDIDHCRPFNHTDPNSGGLTTETNLASICRQHHRFKTFHGWHYHLDPDATLTITTDTGHTLTTHPTGPLARWRQRDPHPDHTDDTPPRRPWLDPRPQATHWLRRARRLAAERTANTTTPPPTNSHPTTDTDPPPF